MCCGIPKTSQICLVVQGMQCSQNGIPGRDYTMKRILGILILRLWVEVTKPISFVSLFSRIVQKHRNTSYRLNNVIIFDSSWRSLAAFPDSKAHWANMGQNWGRQALGGPHVGPMNYRGWYQEFVVGGTYRIWTWYKALQWRHNERDGVSNHRHLNCLRKHLSRRRSKKTSKLRITGLCEGNPPMTGGFLSQRASKRKCFHLMTSSWDFSYDRAKLYLTENTMNAVLVPHTREQNITELCPQTNGRINGHTDGQSDSSIPPFSFVERVYRALVKLLPNLSRTHELKKSFQESSGGRWPFVNHLTLVIRMQNEKSYTVRSRYLAVTFSPSNSRNTP